MRAFPGRWNRARFHLPGNRSTFGAVTALIFLLVAIAMMTALGGRRGLAGGLFGLSLILSVVWLVHHMTDALPLSF
jgi:hypothetical protein